MRATRPATVGVMGSGFDAHRDRAEPLGRWLASQPVNLLTGGGGGVMQAVAEAFCSVEDRVGRSIGVLPGVVSTDGYRGYEGYPNQWVEIPIRTHLPHSGSRGREPASRNHINVLSADVVVALPGSHGTASEVQLAIRYKRPLVAFLHSKHEIPGIPPEVYVERDFEAVKRFVLEHIT